MLLPPFLLRQKLLFCVVKSSSKLHSKDYVVFLSEDSRRANSQLSQSPEVPGLVLPVSTKL